MKLDNFLFLMFLSVFLAQNIPFFDTITNQILRLNYARLIWEPMRDQNKKIAQGHGQFNIDCDNIFLAFEGFKVS